jgi:site-specific DNA-adenine methylase
MIEQFIYEYKGNKYKETIKYINKYPDITLYKTIIEPFGGSFGFIRALEKLYPDNNFKYIVMDTNEDIINLFNLIKNNSEEDNKELLKKYNETIDLLNCDCGKDLKCISKKQVKDVYNNIDDDIIRVLFNNNMMTNGRFYTKKYKKNVDFSIFKKIDFIIQDFKTLNFNEIDEDTLVYLDPPYFTDDCSFYSDRTFNDIFDNIIRCLNELNTILIINNNSLTNYIFKPWLYDKYDKKYSLTKKNNIHYIYYSKK